MPRKNLFFLVADLDSQFIYQVVRGKPWHYWFLSSMETDILRVEVVQKLYLNNDRFLVCLKLSMSTNFGQPINKFSLIERFELLLQSAAPNFNFL